MSRPVDPWCLRETHLDVDDLHRTASLFSLSNGHLGVRGGLEEGSPGSGVGTLLAGVFERRPLTYAEAAYGYPEASEQLAPVADGWTMGLRLDDEPLDVRTGELHEHERQLDLRRGLLERRLRWTAPSGPTVQVTTRRFVSLRRRELHALRYELRALAPARVSLRPVPGCPHTPATDIQPPEDWHSPPLEHEGCGHDPTRSWVAQRATTTGIGVAVTAGYQVVTTAGVDVSWQPDEDGDGDAGELVATLEAGQWLRVDLLTTYAAGDEPSERLQARARTALQRAEAVGWQRLEQEQADRLAEVWRDSDVVVDGDEQVQQAVRFALFHVVQSSAQVRDHGVRVKGLSGTGYHGHTFWDADSFVLPVLDHVAPESAADHLRWRHSTLPRAEDRARRLGLPGATFAWRTISGRECSGYWPAGTAAFHVNADVADAVVRHVARTGDEELAREVGVDLVVQTARLWPGLGHHTDDGSFRLDGVTGPDEYTALQDNNTYTNLMARRNLLSAYDLARRFPEQARRLDVRDEECRRWLRAAGAVVVPRDPVTGVTEQSEGFTRHPPWTFHPTGHDGEPLDAHAPYVELYRRRVVKQADLVLALYLAGDRFTQEQKRRDFAYYEAITVRDSSLSAPVQAVVAAELGHLGLAWDYTRETALMDLADLHGSVERGLHLAALAGTWTALVAGFGGLRDHDGQLRLAPRLPPALSGLAFGLRRGTARVRVHVGPQHTTYRLTAGEELQLWHHGEPVRLTGTDPTAELPVPAGVDPGPRPAQPPGREPLGG